MNCPYCNEPSDQTDSVVRLSNGDRVHFKCSDKMLEEWVELKAENAILRDIVESAEEVIEPIKTSSFGGDG